MQELIQREQDLKNADVVRPKDLEEFRELQGPGWWSCGAADAAELLSCSQVMGRMKARDLHSEPVVIFPLAKAAAAAR